MENSTSTPVDFAALRHLDDVRIPWGTETTAHNIQDPNGLAALIGISGVFYFSCEKTTEDDLAYCINDYLARVQHKLKIFQYPCQEYMEMPSEPFNFKGSHIRSFNEQNYEETLFSFLASSAEEATLPGHYTLEATYFSYKTSPSCFHFCFPVGFLMDQKPDYLHSMITDWAQRLKPLHGTVGFGTILTTYISTATATGGSIFRYLRRFPGLQPNHPVTFEGRLGDGIFSVNWYTFVCDEFLEKVGGKDAVVAQLGERFTVWDYPGGIGIVAGPLPELGDREKGLMPTLYPKLHALLRPLYSKKICRIAERLPMGMSTEDFDKEWMYRFDEVLK